MKKLAIELQNKLSISKIISEEVVDKLKKKTTWESMPKDFWKFAQKLPKRISKRIVKEFSKEKSKFVWDLLKAFLNKSRKVFHRNWSIQLIKNVSEITKRVLEAISKKLTDAVKKKKHWIF